MSPNFALILSALAWNDSPVKKAIGAYATANKWNSMPNGKIHFIAGAVVGATVNFIIQSAKMAADYDRNFDWGELFLCAGAGAFAGLASDTLESKTLLNANKVRSPLPLPIRWGEGRVRGSSLELLEPATRSNYRQFFGSLIAAGLVAYAISGQHASKFSRATRLFLWAFGMSYLSRIALICTTSKRINPISQSLPVTYSNL